MNAHYPPLLGNVYDTCWGVVAAWYPGTPQAAHIDPSLFMPVDYPIDGDVVLMRGGAHCGIYWRNGIIHQPAISTGVIYEQFRSSQAKTYEFYRSACNRCNKKPAKA